MVISVMQLNNLPSTVERRGGTSRRTFFTGVVTIAASGGVVAQSRRSQAKPSPGPVLLYVGTYSSPESPEGDPRPRRGYLPVSNESFNRRSETTGGLRQRFEPVVSGAEPRWDAFILEDETRTFKARTRVRLAPKQSAAPMAG
jgi:hypothetical protein